MKTNAFVSLALSVVAATAANIDVATISVSVPTTVFAIPVVYATASGAPAVTSLAAADAATVPSDPRATKVFSNAAQASAALAGQLRARDASTICPPQPSGIAYKSTPDTPQAFAADPYYGQQALAASVPSGYTQTFSNLNASNSANKYMGYTLLNSYDVSGCAAKCNAITGCNSFGVYFERDPSVDPNSDCCANPPSTVNVKCVFWGDAITTANANNFGQWRNQFEVLIAGSNGYVNTTYLNPNPNPSCATKYPVAGGIQVWNPNNVGGVNSKWLSVASDSSLRMVTGSASASLNGTAFAIYGSTPYMVNANSTTCNNALAISTTVRGKQIASFSTVGTSGYAYPTCMVRTWSDWMVICSVSGVVQTAYVCASDNYSNIYWNAGTNDPAGCVWAALFYHPASNPYAAS